MKLDCKLEKISYDFAHKGTKFEFFSYGNVTTSLEEYLGLKVNVEIKKANLKSSNANGYLWVLLGQLQEKLRMPKEDVYKNYIRQCGVYEVIPIRNEAIPKFTESWTHNGLGWVCETTASKLQGYTNVLAYYGTSVYTKDEMAVLLDQVVQDCIEQGIPTKPQEEIESLLRKMEE